MIEVQSGDSPVPSTPTTAEEAALLLRAQSGDFTAFEALVARYQPRIYGLAYRILGQGHDAEDVTQQTFLTLIEHISDLPPDSALAAWLFRVATNHALKILRRRRLVRFGSPPPGSDEEEAVSGLPHPEYIANWKDTPARLAERAETRRLLDEAVAELDDKLRVVFVLRDIEGLSVRETAELLQISEVNVRVRLMRARLQLRERLTRALGDEHTRVVPDHTHG